MSIGKKAGKGFVKLFQRNMLEKLMGLTTIVILARELTPYDFGLVSITEVLLYTISVFGTTGLSEYLLAYKKDDTKEIFKASFWFNIIITLAVLVVFLCLAPFWADFQNDDRIINISWIAGGIFVASQLSIIPKTWLSRNLQFDKQVRIQTPFIILIPIGKVVAVYAGLGVYSLIIPTLIFTPIQTFLFYKAAGLNVGTKLYTKRWKEIYNFTKHLIGSGLLRRLADQGDKFILGKFLGLEMLGIYNIAMQMAELFTTQLVNISNNILSSVLPKYVHDKNQFYTHYINFLKTFSFIILPFSAIMLVAAKPIILLLYGEKWIAAVLPMQILIVYSALRSVTSSFSIVMNSFHLNKQSFRLNLFFTPVHLIGSVIGAILGGVVGVAISLVIVRSFFYNWRIKMTMDAVEQPTTRWHKDLLPYFLSIVIVITGMWIGSYYLLKTFYVYPIVAVSGIGIAVVLLYNFFVKIFFPKELNIISGFLGATFPKVQPHFNKIFGLSHS
jgi:O-antigen/teichoic acid export membrane protein